MKRIIFVDDEPQLLDGLRSRLRRNRKRWEMVFASGGEEGLEQIRSAPFDVVVSDMRMPGMDGATLLEHVKRESPRTARIVLSGYAKMEAAYRALPVAHQFLSKPCEAEIIENVIERACRLQDLLHDESIQAAVGAIGELPCAPRIYSAVTEALGRANVDAEVVADLIRQDPSICARVLQVVNSAFFGLRQTMTDVRDAVAYLGIFFVRNIVLSAELISSFKPSAASAGFEIDVLQRHCFATASIAAHLVEEKDATSDAFTAGILHDLGLLVLATRAPERLSASIAMAKQQRRPVHEVEKELHGFTHAEVGAYLLGMWGLPYPIVEAIAHHHTPEKVAQREFDVLSAVYVADCLAHEQSPHAEDGDALQQSPLNLDYLERLGVAGRLPEWREIARKQMAP